MGCDIHSIAQVNKNKTWVTVAERVNGDRRDYVTFGALAGVRNYELEEIEPCRGIPTGLTVVPTAFGIYIAKGPEDSLYMGDHSHSWLTLSEINNYLKHTYSPENAERLEGLCSTRDALQKLANDHGVSQEDIRYVFGFDS